LLRKYIFLTNIICNMWFTEVKRFVEATRVYDKKCKAR